MIPNTPFSTPLSSSAKETERRIQNLFQEKKKRPPWPALVLPVMSILLCGFLVSFQTLAAPKGEAEFWNAAGTIPTALQKSGQEQEPSAETAKTLRLPVLPGGILSMQGWFGSPEHQAFVEWMNFLNTYDPDGSILKAAGESGFAVPDGYSAYTCYSQDMADKLDELCGKYGLTLLGESVAVPDTELSVICGGTLPGAENTPKGGYCYADGTLLFDGTCILPGGHEISYQFSRAVKGSLSTFYLSIGSVTRYQLWEYTTQNGVPLLLALSETKALLLADTDSSVVVVNVLLYDGQLLTPETLEAFVQTFDWSAL